MAVMVKTELETMITWMVGNHAHRNQGNIHRSSTFTWYWKGTTSVLMAMSDTQMLVMNRKVGLWRKERVRAINQMISELPTMEKRAERRQTISVMHKMVLFDAFCVTWCSSGVGGCVVVVVEDDDDVEDDVVPKISSPKWFSGGWKRCFPCNA